MSKFLKHFMVVGRGLHFNEGGEGEGSGGEGEGGDAGAGGTYFDSFPENVRGWDEVKNSETPEAFWQQMESHRQHLGQSIRIPGEDAGEKDWEAFNAKLRDKVPTLMHTPDPENPDTLNSMYDRLGRPEAADKYTIPEIKNDEGTVVKDIDHSATEAFKELAHANGLTQKQFNEIVTGVTKMNLAQAAAEEVRVSDNQAAITKEWGAAEDRNYTILKNFAKKTDAPEGLIGALENKTLDPSTAQWMLKAANASFGSSSRGVDDDSGGSSVMSPGEASSARSEIMRNKEHPYWNKMDPQHQSAVKRVRELIILENPETATKVAPGVSFEVGGNTN